MFCARASSLLIRTLAANQAQIGFTGRIASRSFITNAKKFNDYKKSTNKVVIACEYPKSIFSNKTIKSQLRSGSINGVIVMQHRNYTEHSEAEKKQRADELVRKFGRFLTTVVVWGGVSLLVFKYFHPALIFIYCGGAGIYWVGKGIAFAFQQYLKKRLSEDVHLLPNLHDVLRKNRELLNKHIGDFTMPQMEQVISWRARAPGAPSTEPEYLHYTTYVKGDKSRLWLRARGNNNRKLR